LLAERQPPINEAPHQSAEKSVAFRWAALANSHTYTALVLIAVWVAVILQAPQYFNLPVQAASWLTFFALLVTPGYLLGDIVARKLKLDGLERLALAYPLSIVVMALPGMFVLLRHLTITELTTGWIVTSGLMVIIWALYMVLVRARAARPAASRGWAWDEIAMLALLTIAFIYILPELTLFKIDGDAYAVGSFAADAFAGLPLNAREPLFGTDLGPGVRMTFNQSLTMAYLWSQLSSIDPLTLTATASRVMIALWAIIASYMLGKAAGASRDTFSSGRRMGLFVASIQLLIFMVGPFLRGDNASLFFFERTTADKFMVPVTMLPVVFALSIRFLRNGKRSAWWTAALVAVAVSIIHPLIAAMSALALGAFGGFHLLFSLRNRTAIKRSLALWLLIGIVMFLPMVQLTLSRGEDPLAPSYPSTFEGWSIGEKWIPALPFFYVPSLDVYGPLPNLAQLEASDANTATDPFLIWRFAVNMNRRRLILFDLNHYISDPNILYEPPYLLALLLLPLLLWKIHKDIGAQFVVSTSLAILFVMFNPLITPLIGSLVMPWILWRFVWLLPYALIIGMGLYRLLMLIATGLSKLGKENTKNTEFSENAQFSGVTQFNGDTKRKRTLQALAPLTFLLLLGLLVSPLIAQNLRTIDERAAFPYFFPTPQKLMERLNDETLLNGPATVMADKDLSVTLPAYVANANVVAHRAPTTSEIFPADQQDEALQRLIDQYKFYQLSYLDQDALDILNRYDVNFVATNSGSDLDAQLRLAPQWFEWLLDDESFSLYRVNEIPTAAGEIEGNTAMSDRQWDAATVAYEETLRTDPDNLMAKLGLADIAHAQGDFDQAIALLYDALDVADAISPAAAPVIHYQLGQIYADAGNYDQSIAQFFLAQDAAPDVARFHVAMADACLNAGDEECAAEQYALTVKTQHLPNEVTRTIALADLWRQRNYTDRALALYKQAVAEQPTLDNRLMLVSIYQEVGLFEEAEALLETMREENPLSTEVLTLAADVNVTQGKYDEAIALYEEAIRMQMLQGQETIDIRLPLARTLLEANQTEPAIAEIKEVLALDPNNASGYALLGDFYQRHQMGDQATDAYQQAFRLDPSQVGLFLSLSDQLRQQGRQQGEVLDLLQAAIQANPDEATLALALGDSYQRHGDTEEAMEAYKSALDMFETQSLSNTLDPRSVRLSRAYAYTRLGAIREELGELEPAMNYYGAAVAAAPDATWTQIILGDALRRRNDMDDAEAAYQAAIENDPGEVDAYVRLAELKNAGGDSVQADRLYQRALEIAVAQANLDETPELQSSLQANRSVVVPQGQTADAAFKSDETVEAVDGTAVVAGQEASEETDLPTLADPALNNEIGGNTLGLLARIYQDNGQTGQAIQLYQDKIREGEKKGWYPAVLAQYQKGLGDLYLADNQPDKARVAYEHAVTLDAWWPQARLGLARALSDLGDRDGALQQLEWTVEMAPGMVEAQIALADAFNQQGSSDVAQAIYEATAEAYPGNERAMLALARSEQQRDQWEASEESYRNAIALNPGNAEPYVGLASQYIEGRRYDEARALLDEALAIDQQSVNAHLQMGILEQQLGNRDAAVEQYQIATEIGGESISIILIDLLNRNASYEAALDQVQQDLVFNPDDVELLVRLAGIQRTLGAYSEATAALRRAETLGLDDSRLVVELGETLLAQGRPHAALSAYRQTVNQDPDETANYLALSNLWGTQGDYEAALKTLESGVNQARQPAPLYAAMSGLSLQMGDPETANQVLTSALQTMGDDTSLLLAMGAYLQSQDEEKAEAWYTDALSRNPENADLHAALGNYYLNNKRKDDGVAKIEQAVALEPARGGYLLELGNAYGEVKRFEDAESAYVQALVLEPTLEDAYLNLGALYRDQDRNDEAKAIYTQGLAVLPTSGPLMVEFGDYLIQQDELEAGLAMLDQVSRLSPDASTLSARAAVYLTLDDDAIEAEASVDGEESPLTGPETKALQDLEDARRKEPGSVDILIALGDLYQKLGMEAQALQAFTEADELLPGLTVANRRLTALQR